MTTLGLGGSYQQDKLKYGDDQDWSVFDISAASTNANARSVRKIYQYPDSAGVRRAMPVYTAIIHANLGEVTGISWDDGCFFCDINSCDQSTSLMVGNSTVTDFEQLSVARAGSDAGLQSLMGENCFVPATGSGGCTQTCEAGKPCDCDLSVR